ncbi:MAG: PAS domain S-box protein [Gammaproteobacteria bacterium]|nr:PAS domain S-box protein [Gammaproteobacteria bacterium]
MNISIRTLLIGLLLGLPLLLGAYTYFYSITTSKDRIIKETQNDVRRTLTHSADTIRFFLNTQNLSQVQHEISKLGENSDFRNALLFSESRNVIASIHMAYRGQTLQQSIQQGIGNRADVVLEHISSRLKHDKVSIWLDADQESVFGIIPIRYNTLQGALRPDSSSYIFIQQDLSTDLAASNALALNIISVQFLLSLLVILLVNLFVLSRFKLLKGIATSFLSNGDSLSPDDTSLDEISLFNQTITQLAEQLKLATDKLKEQNQFTLNVINSTDEGIFGLDVNGSVTFANQACLRMLGYKSEAQLLGKHVQQLLSLSDRYGSVYSREQNPIQQSLLSGDKLHSEHDIFCTADNTHIEVEYWTSPLRLKPGKNGLVVTFMDISERRKNQHDLIIKDAAIANSPLGIAMGNLDGYIFYVNDAMVKMWGYDSSDEINGQIATTFWQEPIQATKIIELLFQNKNVTTEMMAVRKDGSNFIAHLSANISADSEGRPLCLMASFIDISEQKEIEAALKRSEETYAKAEEIAHIGSWDWNMLNGDLRWTDEIYRIFGQQPQAFGATYEAFVETIHPDDRDSVSAAVGATVADENTPYSIEHRVVRPSGEIRVVHERGKVYRNETGEPIRMIGTVHDITDHKIFEKALREERNFVSAILDSAGALVVVLDKRGKVIRFNRACEETTGFKQEEILGYYIWEKLLKPDMSETAKQMFSSPEKIPSEYTNHWLNKQGAERLIMWSNRPLQNEHGEVDYIVSMGIDVTEKNATEKELERHRKELEILVDERTQELRQTQDELVRKERLATLGQLTATVSHELRNPLGAMRPSMYLIKKMVDQDNDKLSNAITRVERNIQRCDHIIDELLDFTRITDISEKDTRLDDWLKNILEEQHIPDSIRLLADYGLNDVHLNLDPERMRRAVINIVENACQSMTEDGFRPETELSLTISTEHSNNRVSILIEDTGPGIDEKTMHKIFEPLFSTKGFGVGLGLPTVKQIMQQHQGDIEVTSTPGKGTCMTLWLPDNRIID